MLKVAIAVAPGRAPAWHGWCIDALRALENVETVVVPAARDGDLRDADVIVDLAGAGIAGEPRLGVWSFSPGSANGALPFAREIGSGTRTFEIALVRRSAQRLEPLRAGRFAVTAWYPSTMRLAFAEAARWPATLVALLASGHDGGAPFDGAQGDIPDRHAEPRRSMGHDPSPFDGAHAQRDTRQGDIPDRHAEPCHPEPVEGRSMGHDPSPFDGAQGDIEIPAPLTLWERVRFGAALVANLARALWDDLFEIVEWNVGFVDGDARLLLAAAPLAVRWLPPPPRGTLIADPFVVERDGITALFVEAFEYRSSHGAIDALVLAADGSVSRRVRALDAATHLSYPYPVEIDGELYLVPENCAGNEVALYRCARFPDTWERESAIFPAFDGLDTTLFAHDGRWWAFCTRYSHGAAVALFAFHATSPRGPWTAHALNPIVCDASCARSAGQPFVVDGVWYRPGQDCSRSYGGGLAIARIDALTPSDYRETVVRRIDGRGLGRWSDGIHTVSFMRGALVVDGKRSYRSARKLAWALPRLLKRSWRPPGPTT